MRDAAEKKRYAIRTITLTAADLLSLLRCVTVRQHYLSCLVH